VGCGNESPSRWAHGRALMEFGRVKGVVIGISAGPSPARVAGRLDLGVLRATAADLFSPVCVCWGWIRVSRGLATKDKEGPCVFDRRGGYSDRGTQSGESHRITAATR
jgi:hypothetical protein